MMVLKPRLPCPAVGNAARMSKRSKSIFGLACIVLVSALFLSGCSSKNEETYDAYTFTVNLDDQLCDDVKIKKEIAINVKRDAKEEFHLDKERDLRIVGVVGHEKAGKTWLINSMFNKKLKTGKLAKKDEHGLNMLYVPDGSWLIVEMLGSLRARETKSGSTLWEKEQGFIGQHLVETLRYMIMVQLCHAIIVVIAYPMDYITYGRHYAGGDPGGLIGDTHTRLSSMLTQASNTGKDAIITVAHNFWSIQTEKEAEAWFAQSIKDFEKNVKIGSNVAITSRDSGSKNMLFNGIFQMGSEDIVVANYGLAKDDLRTGQAILERLRHVVKSPTRVNILRELQSVMQGNFHHILDGRHREKDLRASLTSDNITIAIENKSPHHYVLRTMGLNLACKERLIEANQKPVPGSLLINDVRSVDHIIQRQSDTIIEDVQNGQRIKQLRWKMPGVRQIDTDLELKDGNLFLVVNVRSRRDHSIVKYSVGYGKLPIVFGRGRKEIRLHLDGWSFNIEDPQSRRLRDGELTLNVTQDL